VNLLLVFLYFWFCSFSDFASLWSWPMLATFLDLAGSLIPLKFYSASYTYECFSSFSLWIITLSILCNAGLVDMTTWAYPCLKGPYFSIETEEQLAGYSILGWRLFSLSAWMTLLHTFELLGFMLRGLRWFFFCVYLCI
jgi:hypothetical protein